MTSECQRSWVWQVCPPAFVINQESIGHRCNELLQIAGVTTLYSTKALALTCALDVISEKLGGFSVSSVFEALLAKQWAKADATIHFTSPGLSDRFSNEIADTCTHVSLNSLTQW